MKNKSILKSFQFFLVFALASSCDILKENPTDSGNAVPSSVILSGTVSEVGGSIISNASVTIGSQTQQTNLSGTFNFGTELTDGNYPLTVSKTGYISIIRTISVKKDSPKNLTLSLFKKSAGVMINSSTGGLVGPLSIPANALSSTSEISVTNVLGSGLPNTNSNGLIVAAYVLEPNGLVFKSPASLQIPNPFPGIDPSSLIGRSGSEVLAINSSGGNLSVPINHFSEVYFEVSSDNFRYTVSDNWSEQKLTTKTATCGTTKAEEQIVLSGASINILSNSPIQNNEIFLLKIEEPITTSQRTVTISVTRKTGDKSKQLAYKINNRKYIFEMKTSSGWNKIAEVIVPEILSIAIDFGEPCHDQGIMQSGN